jgi:hypothetical protein
MLLFLFLAGAVIAVFAFASIVVLVTTPARERQARDRMALLKTLAENPSEQAREGNRDSWQVPVAAGMIPFLIGCVLLGTGLVGIRTSKRL